MPSSPSASADPSVPEVPDHGTFRAVPDVATTADAIGRMEVRGAARIGRHAARALGRLAEETVDDGLVSALDEAGRTLLSARPTAVSLRNAINLTLDGFETLSGHELGASVRARAAAYVQASEAAPARIATAFADGIDADTTVLTHCHSSLAVACLVEAHRRHGGLRVFADETRPWWQGHITTRMLAEAGVDVTLIVDSAAHHVMETEGVDVVVTGADTVTADGALYNKVGTRAVSLGASNLGIPHMVAAETHKFSPYSLQGDVPTVEQRDAAEVIDPARRPPGVKVQNPVFDRTAPTLVDRYITDRGTLAPREVQAFVKTEFPIKERWI